MGTISTMLCFLASVRINCTVGPSGTRSVMWYHLVSCSAQKYGP
jgi:hypothetical protein